MSMSIQPHPSELRVSDGILLRLYWTDISLINNALRCLF